MEKKDLQKMIQASKLTLLGQLAAGIAHELRNPLAVLKMECDELTRLAEKLTPEQKTAFSAHCEMTDRNIGKMTAIIDRIRSMSASPSTGFRRLNIHDVLGEVEHWSSRLLQPLSIQISVDAGASDPYFFGNETQIEEVFLNLIRNASDAIRSSGKGSEIRVRIGSGDGQIFVDVEDDGPGIQPKDLPFIYDPFFTTKPEGEGVGLGLSIVAQMVQEHGGTIEADSRPGRGTKFRISLPHDRRNASRKAEA